MTEPTSVGEIVAYFRANLDDFDRGARTAQAEADRLDGKSVNIRITTNAAEAVAQIKAVSAAADSSGKKAGESAKGWGTLATAVAALGPAAVPIGATVAAATDAAVLGIGSLTLAVKGAQQAMKDGTPIGVQYATGLGVLRQNLAGIEQTAAGATLAGFNRAVSESSALMPALNREVNIFGATAGGVVDHVLHGLIGGFTTLGPTLNVVARYADGAAIAFDKYANGGGLAKFGAYVQQELPQVVATIEAVSKAAASVVGAITPLGGGSLTIIREFADVIDHIPPQALTAIAAGTAAWALSSRLLAPALQAVKTAESGSVFANASGLIGGLSKAVPLIALYTAGAAAAGAATKDWATSTDQTKSLLGEFVDVINPTGGSFLNFAQVARDAQSSQADAALQSTANYYAATFGNLIQARTAAQSGKVADGIAAAFHGADVAGTSLTGLATQYGTVATAMEKQLAAAQALDGEGTGQKITVQGQTIAVNEYQAAMAKTNGVTTDALALLAANKAAVGQYSTAVQNATAEQDRINTALQSAATITGLSTDRVSQYADAVGVSALAISNGTISISQFDAVMKSVSGTLRNADTANQGWLDAVAKFDPATATAADRANLFAAALTAVRGVTLDMANANLTAVTDTNAVAAALKQYGSSVSSTGQLLGQLTDVGGKWVVQQPQLAAGSSAIASALSQQAAAATDAARQVYQNELGTKTSAAAMNDAIGVYAGFRQELIKQAEQSGRTQTQAEGLVNTYAAFPSDKKTLVGLLQGPQTQQAIGKLTVALNGLNKTVTAALDLDPSRFVSGVNTAQRALNSLKLPPDLPAAYSLADQLGLSNLDGTALGQLPATKPAPKGTGSGTKGTSRGYATGGAVADGYFTVGEQGPELGYKRGAQVSIFPNAQSMTMLRQLSTPRVHLTPATQAMAHLPSVNTANSATSAIAARLDTLEATIRQLIASNEAVTREAADRNDVAVARQASALAQHAQAVAAGTTSRALTATAWDVYYERGRTG